MSRAIARSFTPLTKVGRRAETHINLSTTRGTACNMDHYLPKLLPELEGVSLLSV